MKVQRHKLECLKVVSDFGGEKTNLPIPKTTDCVSISQWMIDHIYETLISMYHPMVDITKREEIGLRDALLQQSQSASYLLDLIRDLASAPSPGKSAPNVPSQAECVRAINNWIISGEGDKR